MRNRMVLGLAAATLIAGTVLAMADSPRLRSPSPSTWGGRATGLSVAGTTYFAPFFAHVGGATTGELLASVPTSVAGTFTNLRVTCATAPGNTFSTIATFRVGAATPSSGLVATITNTGTSASDLTHAVVVAAGDQVDLTIVAGAGGTAAGNCIYSTTFTPAS